jgi:ATP-binding cassette, subfamily F, member 3
LAEQKRIIEIAGNQLDDEHQAKRYEEALFAYEKLGGDFFLKRAHQFLKGLLLANIALDKKAATLSGGQKRKLALTGVLLRGVDVLVLDEPTNNLDLPALRFVEKYLQKTKATVVLASHDRAFLDAVAEKVFEIHWYTRTIEQFAGGWSDYVEQKRHRLRRQQELWREQEEERSRLEASEEQKRAWVERIKDLKAPDNDKMATHFKRERATKKFNASAKAIVSRLKRLDEHDEPIVKKPPTILLGTPEALAGSVALTNVVAGYSGGFITKPFSFDFPYGARVALLGNNGVGKTTLIKTLTGQMPALAGTVTLGAGVQFGYFLQEHDTLDQEQKVFDYMKNQEKLIGKDEALFELGRFGLPPDAIDDKLRELSPGERVRVILAKLVLQGANTLILDEPTNHLDLDAIEALEDALVTFPGTLIVVTHDREFLKNLNLTTHIELA